MVLEGTQILTEPFHEWCERNGYRATKVDTSCSGLMCMEWYRLREPDGFSFDVNVTTTNTGTTISRRS
jgi:hypothetical protein